MPSLLLDPELLHRLTGATAESTSLEHRPSDPYPFLRRGLVSDHRLGLWAATLQGCMTLLVHYPMELHQAAIQSRKPAIQEQRQMQTNHLVDNGVSLPQGLEVALICPFTARSISFHSSLVWPCLPSIILLPGQRRRRQLQLIPVASRRLPLSADSSSLQTILPSRPLMVWINRPSAISYGNCIELLLGGAMIPQVLEWSCQPMTRSMVNQP